MRSPPRRLFLLAFGLLAGCGGESFIPPRPRRGSVLPIVSVVTTSSAAPIQTVAPEPPKSPCPPGPHYSPLAFSEYAGKRRDFGAFEMPRLNASDKNMEAGAHGLERAIDASVGACPTRCDRAVDCEIVRNDGRSVSIHCVTLTASMTNAISRDIGLNFRRNGHDFQPLSIRDFVKDNRTAQTGDYFVLGDDELLLGKPDPMGAIVEIEGAVDLRAKLVCDDVLHPDGGLDGGPLSHATRFDRSSRKRYPVFYAAGGDRAKTAAAMNADIEGWFTALRAASISDADSVCRVVTSTADLVSVLCMENGWGGSAPVREQSSRLPPSALGLTYRIADAKRISGADLLAHAPGAIQAIANRCFADEVASKEAIRAPSLGAADLEAFGLERSDVLFAFVYESSNFGNAPLLRTKQCRIPYGVLKTSPALLGGGAR